MVRTTVTGNILIGCSFDHNHACIAVPACYKRTANCSFSRNIYDSCRIVKLTDEDGEVLFAGGGFMRYSVTESAY